MSLSLPKKKFVCAGILAFYNDKVLFLYDKKYRHCALPQGKVKSGERSRETALRELAEETGYCDAQVIRKIKQYQYHYQLDGQIIYKQIRVFLVKLLSLKKKAKELEEHEFYTNKFFSFNEVEEKAKYEVDKQMVRMVKKYLKKR